MARASVSGLTARVALVLALAAAVGGGAAWLSDPARLPIRQVQLHGVFQRQDPARLEAVIAAALDGNMLTQDLAGLERRLQDIPWVRQARIRRAWPSALRIEVIEQVPVARWEGGWLLNADGERFVLRGQPEPELVRLAGLPGRERALLDALARIDGLLRPYGMRLVRLEETKFHSLRLTMKSGLRLTLGRARPYRRLARWLRYAEAYARRAPARATHIDLRYPNGFAVRSPTDS